MKLSCICKGQFCGTESIELPKQKSYALEGIYHKRQRNSYSIFLAKMVIEWTVPDSSKPEGFAFKSTNHLELTMARFRLHVVNSSKFQLGYSQKAFLHPFQLLHDWRSRRV